MSKPITFQEASLNDAKCLSKIAFRSKAYWGYSAEFMDACVDELTVSSACIGDSNFHYVVAIVDEAIVGYYALEGLFKDEIELGALFVDPDHIGTGVGRALMEKAKKHAASLGAWKLNIQGDPNAVSFYKAAGGQQTGSKESESIPGRYLPTFRIPLN